MAAVSCAVERCASPARWVRTSRADLNLPSHVCTEHLQSLRREKWVVSASYEPILPTEPVGTEVDGL
jgi:hypothetical protein